MTILAEPTTRIATGSRVATGSTIATIARVATTSTIATATRITTATRVAATGHRTVLTAPGADLRRQRTAVLRTAGPALLGPPVDVVATTEQLLRRRDGLPADHPERAELRTQVIEQNLPMANRLARRYHGRGELLDDLRQVAALALVKAVDGYDSSRDIAFVSYAVPSILGGLKRHFRDTAWGIRISRSAQELSHEVTSAVGELCQRLGRSPTQLEIADHLRVDVADVRTAIEARQAYHLASLNVPHRNSAEEAELGDLLGATDARYAEVDDQVSLQPFLAALPRRERRILTLRFYGSLTQTQIAAEVGLSQMHVSRVLKQTLAQLRTAMA